MDNVTREPGLILTKEQIKNIKYYEMLGLRLPVELQAVITYLGYEKGAGNGLDAEHFQDTFKTVRNHASTWNPLRVDLLAVGSKLRVFAGQMLVFGQGMEEIFADIKKGPLTPYNIKTLEDLNKVELELGKNYPGLELDAEDKETVKDFSIYLDKMFTEIKKRQTEANQLKERLDKFSFDLRNTVYSAVKLRLSAIDNNTLGAEIKALNLVIEERAKNIDLKTEAYNKLVKDAIGSAATLNVVGIGMSIYLGVEAENIRKERNKMREAQARDIATMNTKDAILGRLNTVRLELQNLDMIIVDADTATRNLVHVWSTIASYIDQSSELVPEITNELILVRFILEFRLVIQPWKDIQHDTHLLLDVFKQADDEFRIEYEQNAKGI
ncbi:hypothetical protein IV01_00105 [Pseudomonas syringae]|uniref:Alpha-xenorhabdolysin family binary toxin subunit A n=1 Tax=Pseudomonas syringae TaxID=317 RepID=A0A085VRF3_PSESX|nr:hypothetical protein IV01_00105 [Pseudomonas syringae]